MRHGTTLIELLVVLLLLSVILGIGAPRAAHWRDRAAVHAAADRLVVALERARRVALSRDGVALLNVSAESLRVRTVEGNDTALIWWGPGPREEQVSLTAPQRPIVFGPNGWAIGFSNATYRLERGDAVRQVVISRRGRVRIGVEDER